MPNRLTYPELLPEELHNNHLYNDENELYDKVKNCILNINEIRKTKIRDEFKKYDWTTMCPVYDKLFSSIIN